MHVSAEVHMHILSCWVCGCTFGVPFSVENNKKSKGETLFCPNGCRLGLGEPDWKKRQRELEKSLETANRRADTARRNADYERSQKEQTEKRLSATKGVVTRMKNRASKGVCPCCNRHFANLQRHMESQHPNYTSED